MKYREKSKLTLNKVKRKRQTSIITIFLWIFLIATMITLVASGMKNKNALEVTDNNWNILLSMYDKSGDTPNVPVEEVTWNATIRSETRQMLMQINYACTTGKEYQPGEIVIEIPGIARDTFSARWTDTAYRNFLSGNVISADEKGSTTKKYDWNYIYDSQNNMYTFTNNNTIGANEHFEGAIQILYNLPARFKIKTDVEFQAKIRENIDGAEELIAMNSNICSFHYTATKKIYTLTKTAEAAPKADYTIIEDILNDYYWVKYKFNWSSDDGVIVPFVKVYNADGTYKLISNPTGSCVREELPEGCVVYDNSLKKVEPVEGNNVYYLTKSDDYFVGYPRTQYKEGDTITNKVTMLGRYEDEQEMVELASAEVSTKLVEFDFEYRGELYEINKINQATVMYKESIKRDKSDTDCRIISSAFYTGSLMDVEIGDDLLYITRENGDITRLKDDEYNFSSIFIAGIKTYNKYSESGGEILLGYDYDIQVRYAGTDEYVSYKSGTVTSNTIGTLKFDRDDIVGVKFIIKDLDKTLYGIAVWPGINIYTDDVGIGKLYNFSYLQVYNKDDEGNRTLANEQTLSNYTTESTKLNIAEYDKKTYGTYIQRAVGSTNIKDGYLNLGIRKTPFGFKDNQSERKYEMTYVLETHLDIRCYDPTENKVIKVYDILPKGEILVSTKEEIIESIYLNNLGLKTKDGTDLKAHIKKHTTVDIDYNYKDSGRTKITITYNLNELDWSYYFTNYSFNPYIGVKLNIEKPYDNVLENGNKYTNYTYAMWENQEYGYYKGSYSKGNVIKDNGVNDVLSSDIDEDGITDENLVYDYSTETLSYVEAAHQSVLKQVRTDQTKGTFVDGTAEASLGSEYDYKLRVQTGANSVKNIKLYDTLETVLDENGNEVSTGWKGEFLKINTEYAEEKGIEPVVYYSEEKNPGNLEEVPDKWKILDDSVDKTKVKSICIDLGKKADGTDFELPSNNVIYVLVKMKAPTDEKITTLASNMFNVTWKSLDKVEGIYSNKVSVELYKGDIVRKIEGEKIWEDEDNKYGARPESVTIKLLQDGVEYKEVTTDASKDWKYSFGEVPKYKNNEEEYNYEIEEESVPNYETTYEGYNITNKIVLTNIEAEKKWEDNENEAGKRAESITLQLKDGENIVKEKVVTGETNWKCTFEDIVEYREDGSKIIYTIDEKEELNEFYIKEIVGFTITNRFVVPEDRIKIVGTKVWEDNENEANKRPESVVLQVKNGEEIVTEQVVTKETNYNIPIDVDTIEKGYPILCA